MLADAIEIEEFETAKATDTEERHYEKHSRQVQLTGTAPLTCRRDKMLRPPVFLEFTKIIETNE